MQRTAEGKQMLLRLTCLSLWAKTKLQLDKLRAVQWSKSTPVIKYNMVVEVDLLEIEMVLY